MVSKEYVQTAHPYDRDLASLGAWIETGFSSRGPLAGDSNCFPALCQVLEYQRDSAAPKKIRGFARVGACLVMT